MFKQLKSGCGWAYCSGYIVGTMTHKKCGTSIEYCMYHYNYVYKNINKIKCSTDFCVALNENEVYFVGV